MHNWRFEVYRSYTPTEWTVCLLVWAVVVLGFEIRPSFPKDDTEYPGFGASAGVIIFGWWIGWFKFR